MAETGQENSDSGHFSGKSGRGFGPDAVRSTTRRGTWISFGTQYAHPRIFQSFEGNTSLQEYGKTGVVEYDAGRAHFHPEISIRHTCTDGLPMDRTLSIADADRVSCDGQELGPRE